MSIQQLLAWLIAGVLVGSFTGMLVKRKKQGFGWLTNLGIGLAGAIIGGVIFWVFNIDLGISELSISAQDLVATFLGTLLLLLGLWGFRKYRGA